VGTRSSDFNYKVALASGLKSLQAGRLRQAEEQFRYLLTRFPAADGGYRGLAKVLIEQEDRPAALRMLLDGGASVAKAGQRSGAIGLYRDATALDPHDLTAHRRLAAALILSGERSAAADEYVRYIEAARLSGATERARLEAEHALERITDSAELVHIARRLGMHVEEPAHASVGAASTAVAPHAVETERFTTEERAALLHSAFGGAPTPEATPPSRTSWRITPQPAAEPEHDSPAEEPTTTPIHAADPWASESDSVSDPHSVTLGENNGEQPAEDADSQAVEAKAARYLAKHDPRGGDAALEAARRYIADGRNDAASDLLLQLIASGVADHDAQRLLVDVVRTLGKRDVAKAKCQLLVQALRLDGREDLAAEVEQLALAD
jgi:thioredoxin-like negative regulator of GroEL